MDKNSQQTMHSPHSLPGTKEKYESEREIGGMAQSSTSGDDIKKVGKYQQQFWAGLLTLPDAKEMTDGSSYKLV
ncbi:MAG: hypothetical protein C4516_09465 [Oxalobacter sp.]|nr:MAG: hypothetical protein C4516_09465 [Oxalobacter sp.]